MKYSNISIKNFVTLWPIKGLDPYLAALTVDEIFNKINTDDAYEQHRQNDPYQSLNYFLYRNNKAEVALLEEKEHRSFHNGYYFIDLEAGKDPAFRRFMIPLNPMMKKYHSISGRHSLYCHGFFIDNKWVWYTGITKQNWIARYNQHLSSARSGSPYIFHEALRKYQHCQMVHKLIAADLDYETAMECEEKWVNLSLYPLGLNMIPGGFAGLRYLHKLGINARNAKQKENAIIKISGYKKLKGVPNPLCAARWINDQEFINGSICSRDERLTVEQVRLIRMYSDFGKDDEEIKKVVNPKREHQIRNVISGKRYSKVK